MTIKTVLLFLIRLDQIRPERIKIDKTWLDWIFHLELRFSTSLESFSLLRTRSWMMLLVKFMMSSWNCSLNLCLRWAFSLSAVARFSIMALVISSKKNQPAFRALSRSAPFVPPHWNANCSWTSLALTEMKKIKKFASDHLNYFSYLIGILMRNPTLYAMINKLVRTNSCF